jgi:hypothetical protein
VSSKLLAAFKLPKFDGSPRHWKAWDRSLQRFLGLHQLDYVLQEDFLSLLPHPDAANANKIVYFLIEEAVTIGTLAAKYIRQAPKWSGHDAYNLLYNRFVFSGPQTSTILLAELSNIRFLRDESPSEFCIRLVELLEELETVPGTAAVCMNDTQKLGYLLSAIRHETDLQAVYVQLQKDQLKGTVTFEEACDFITVATQFARMSTLTQLSMGSIVHWSLPGPTCWCQQNQRSGTKNQPHACPVWQRIALG